MPDEDFIINNVIDMGLCPKIARFHVQGEFDGEMSQKFSDFYYDCKKTGVTHAILDIDSHGGYVHVCDNMCTFIEQGDICWIGVARGACMSCGIILLAACTYRYAAKRADLMFHDISSSSWGKTDEMLESAKRTKKDAKRTIVRFSKRTNHDAAWWYEKANSYASKDFYMTATTAKKLGVVDDIGTPIFTIIRQHSLNMELTKGV